MSRADFSSQGGACASWCTALRRECLELFPPVTAIAITKSETTSFTAIAIFAAIAFFAVIHRTIFPRLFAVRLVPGEGNCAHRRDQDRKQEFHVASHTL
jgi:hypothetical protein